MESLSPLTITGRDPRLALTFPAPVLLAPMDGVTDQTFRDLVLDLGHAGGACTEFVRVSASAWGVRVLRRELGEPHENAPVGLQIMAPGTEYLAETVENAERAGAPWIDLNFGCPVKRVFNKCAGSALLDHPERIEEIVSTAVSATGVPVSAKIRAGVDDDTRLDEVLDAAAAAGAAMVTLHARLRRHSYKEPARWEWIARAAERLREAQTPLIGNGGVECAADVARMMRETGCQGVMIGRAAIADPWIFREARGGAPASRAEAVAFARAYFDILCPPEAKHHGLGRFKMLLRVYRAGGFFAGRDEERVPLLRARDPAAVRAWLDAEEARAASLETADPVTTP